jgi:hypothetical protein
MSRLRRGREHDAGEVVVAKNCRLIELAGGQHDVLCPDLVQAIAGKAAIQPCRKSPLTGCVPTMCALRRPASARSSGPAAPLFSRVRRDTVSKAASRPSIEAIRHRSSVSAPRARRLA